MFLYVRRSALVLYLVVGRGQYIKCILLGYFHDIDLQKKTNRNDDFVREKVGFDSLPGHGEGAIYQMYTLNTRAGTKHFH